MGSRMLWIAIMAALVIVPGLAGAEGSSVEDGSEERSVVFLNQNPAPQAAEVSLGEEVLGFLEKPVSFTGRDHELNRQLAFQLQSDQGSDVSSVAASGAKKINPGRAILMSALIPGAGQFYAASNMESNTIAYIKSAVFFAAELGFWTGAILYAKKGQDKEDEYELYADKNWNEEVYREWEYWLATNKGGQADSLYPYTKDQWEILPWDARLQYLPTNFTHKLPDSKDQQYYEMIGKYLTQFGAAWDDIYPENPSEWSAFFNTFYDDETFLNVHSVLANTYAQMRYDSNKLLDKSAAFFMAIMVNHVVSAVDAGFTVRLHNKRVMSGEVTAKTTFFNGEPVVMGGVNLTF